MRWLLVVKMVCLCLLTSCGSAVEQELIGSTQAGTVRSTVRLLLNPIRGREASVQATVRGVGEQKSYDLLVGQLLDIRWEVVNIRTTLERKFAANIKELKTEPLIAEELKLANPSLPKREIDKDIALLKQKTVAQYEEWATQMAEDLRSSLGANQLYQPEKPELQLNDMSAAPLQTMGGLMFTAETVIGIIAKPLRL